MLSIDLDPLGVLRAQALRLTVVAGQVEEPGPTRAEFMNKFPATIAQSQQRQRVIGKKQGHLAPRFEQGTALVFVRNSRAQQIQNRRRRVYQTGDSADPDLLTNQTGSSNAKGNVDILIVNEQRVTIIAFVPAERLAVVAQNHKQGFLEQVARLEPLKQFSHGSVAVMQRIKIAGEIVIARELPRTRKIVRMMTGNRQISEEECPALRQ